MVISGLGGTAPHPLPFSLQTAPPSPFPVHPTPPPPPHQPFFDPQRRLPTTAQQTACRHVAWLRLLQAIDWSRHPVGQPSPASSSGAARRTRRGCRLN